ncbi:hypothetical protein HOA93_04490 [bacterium]|nr:hypothetical protein [bacterium]
MGVKSNHQLRSNHESSTSKLSVCFSSVASTTTSVANSHKSRESDVLSSKFKVPEGISVVSSDNSKVLSVLLSDSIVISSTITASVVESSSNDINSSESKLIDSSLFLVSSNTGSVAVIVSVGASSSDNINKSESSFVVVAILFNLYFNILIYISILFF